MKYQKLIKAIVFLQIVSLNSCCILGFDCFPVSTGELDVYIIDSSGKDLLDTNVVDHRKLESISHKMKEARWLLSIKDTSYPNQLTAIRIMDLLFFVEEDKLISDTLYLNFEDGNTDTLIYDKISDTPKCCTVTKFTKLEYNGELFIVDDVFPEIRYVRK